MGEACEVQQRTDYGEAANEEQEEGEKEGPLSRNQPVSSQALCPFFDRVLWHCGIIRLWACAALQGAGLRGAAHVFQTLDVTKARHQQIRMPFQWWATVFM